ncbi:MAG: riboflavin synthase [Defluviitaleaceae bacterium]|nr:riboflavin synthase [Defluviitaleaceae bacterium]
MFTGIIEEIGTVTGLVNGTKSSRVTIRGTVIFSDLKLGDSVSTNGVCLTVSAMTNETFTADVMHETLNYTALKGLTSGTKVNLERAMRADGRFGGHLVSGHIDGTGTIRKITRDDNALIYNIATQSDIVKYVVKKGSIAIDGISLTVTHVDDLTFSVSIIPHTLQETILVDKKAGDVVNLEVDMLAKYIEKLLLGKDNKTDKQSKITPAFLIKNGF